MAKSGNSKVIFVPMQLQSDVVGQLANHPSITAAESSAAGGSAAEGSGLSVAGRAAVLNSMSDV